MSDPPSETTPFALRLFGPFEAVVGSHPLPRLHSRKGQWLLALLALRHGREVSREWLAGTLWPDATEEQAHHNLRTTLTDLRRALDGAAVHLVARSRLVLSLDLAEADIDVIAFDDAVAIGDLASLGRAVALYRGPLLEGCIEEWVLSERRAREDACLKALETLAEDGLAKQKFAAAVVYLRQLLCFDPLRETAHRALLHCLVEQGCYAEAVGAYRELRLRLYRELRIEPDPETRSLYRRIREKARQTEEGEGRREGGRSIYPACPPSTSLQPRPLTPGLPCPLTALVGRETETREIAALIDQARLVTLVGPGGIGKTRLAVHVATEIADDYPDGVAFADVASITDPTRVPGIVAEAVGAGNDAGRFDPESASDQMVLKVLTAHLSERSFLLVLDNCEHLSAACSSLVETLLRICSGLRILATSRQSLALPGEAVYQTPSLSVPEELLPGSSGEERVDAVRRSEAGRLFVGRARAAAGRFALSAENAAAVTRILRRLDGLPLALEMAAALVRNLPIEAIADRLDDGFHSIVTGSGTASSRHRSLQATLDWSYSLLPESERTFLRRLSIFPTDFALDAAETLGDGTGTAEVAVLALLTGLVEKSLVLFDEKTGRYRLLETVKQYARERLHTAGEEEAARERYRDWAISLAKRTVPQLSYGAGWYESHARLRKERPHLRNAVEWALQRDGRDALWPAVAMIATLNGMYDGMEGIRLTEQSLIRDRNAPPGLRARALYELSRTWIGFDESRAESRAAEALTQAREIGDRDIEANALGLLADAASRKDDRNQAARLFREAIEVAGDVELQPVRIELLRIRADDAYRRGDLDDARLWYEEALRSGSGIDGYSPSMAAYALAGVLARQGEMERAEALCRKVLSSAYGDQDPCRGRVMALIRLSALALLRGDRTAARALAEEGVSLSRRRLPGVPYTGHVLEMLGRVKVAQGEIDGVRALLTRNVRVYLTDEITWRYCLVHGIESIARLSLTEGKAERAARYLGAAQALLTVNTTWLPIESIYDALYRRTIDDTRKTLDGDAFTEAWEEGVEMTTEDAIADVLGQDRTTLRSLPSLKAIGLTR